jgi:hypothetical protein
LRVAGDLRRLVEAIDDAPRVQVVALSIENELGELAARKCTATHSVGHDAVGHLRVERLLGIVDELIAHLERGAEGAVVAPAGDLHIAAASEAKAVARLRVSHPRADRRAGVVFIEIAQRAALQNRPPGVGALVLDGSHHVGHPAHVPNFGVLAEGGEERPESFNRRWHERGLRERGSIGLQETGFVDDEHIYPPLRIQRTSRHQRGPAPAA